MGLGLLRVGGVLSPPGRVLEDSSHVDQAMLGVKAGGTWSVVEAPLPSNADTSRDSVINAVSCPEVGTCVATGSYKDSTGNTHGLIETLSGGTWSPMDAPVPSDARTGADYFSYLKSVDCQSAPRPATPSGTTTARPAPAVSSD